MSDPTASPGITIPAPEPVLALLDKLHTLSETQEAGFNMRAIPPDEFRAAVADKFIALDRDKSAFMYSLLRATGATTIVEAGTSYGVSTIYLALAARANAELKGSHPLVIGTEHEPAKAERALEYLAQAGVKEVVDLRVGDLRETLAENMPSVDMLLLDIWTPIALPALKLTQPHFRPGAVVLADNSVKSKNGYRELYEYVRAPNSGFEIVTLPYSGGLDMFVYFPPAK